MANKFLTRNPGEDFIIFFRFFINIVSIPMVIVVAKEFEKIKGQPASKKSFLPKFFQKVAGKKKAISGVFKAKPNSKADKV